jgi:enoyl-[acyl-carrier protein] reductase / trans-2-enoyl-CoA reductase (NAD+)
MIIQPKIRGFICTAAHPQGCFENVKRQIGYAQSKGPFIGPKNVLIIGASTGYGLASRIMALEAGASTVGVSFERPADVKRTASPGWYNTAAFEYFAQQAGRIAYSINGDAFTSSIKEQTIEVLKNIGPVDLVIYSVAAPKRIHPVTGEVYHSVLKPIGNSYRNKTVDPMTGVVKEIEIEPATPAEITATEMVMGGEDWMMWIEALLAAGLLAKNVITLAYSYIGPELTFPIYKDGTIGAAKRHLHQTAREIDRRLAGQGGRALISINKALVTQASSAIPVVPLYISLLYKVMKERGTHEGCIEQMDRLFRERLYGQNAPVVDTHGFLRLDDWEMDPETQATVSRLWREVNSENIDTIGDLEGYRTDFYQLFGFNFPESIDYEADCDPNVPIPSMDSLRLC